MITHQQKPCQWGCLATSFAMALDIRVENFFAMAGHDGSEIIFPDLREPWCRRGFHYCEAVWVAMQLGYSATPLDMIPVIGPTKLSGFPDVKVCYTPFGIDHNRELFASLINTSRGVLEGRTRLGGFHAVAFEAGFIFDPDGPVYSYTIEECEKRGFFHTRLWSIKKVPDESPR